MREHISQIVNAPAITKQDSLSLRKLRQTVEEHRRAIDAIGHSTAEMDIYTVFHVVKKMDPESRRQGESVHPGTDIYTNSQLNTFLTTRCRALEASSAKSSPLTQAQTSRGVESGQGQNAEGNQNAKRNQSFATG